MKPSESPRHNGASRRQFLKVGAATIAVAASGAELLPAQTTKSSEPVSAFELEEVDVSTLRSGLQSGKYTARSLAEKYLGRIEAIDKSGPGLNSVLEMNPDALSIADALDHERSSGKVRSPLHGIPVLIKGNITTADRMQTTAGSLALLNAHHTREAFVVARLREAGAVILGKTNLSEWANFRSTHSTSGWSGGGGQTHNPYALDRNPSGSSSGSAVAVSASLCAIAVGTETDGSIVSPASTNGVVGLKPTVGLVSRSGIVPISHTQDTAGPITRTVADAAALLGALAAVDAADAATQMASSHIERDYTRYLDANGLKGARIGVVRKQYTGYNAAMDKVFDEALVAMRHAGAELIDPADVPTISKLDEPEMEVLLFEFKANLNAFLSALGPSARVHSLKELIDFNEKHRERELQYFGQELLQQSEAKGPLTAPEYLKALSECRRLSREEGIDAAMNKFRLDALVAPTGNPAWPTDFVNGDHFVGSSSTLAAVAGYPSISVPMGFVFGLPVGISFFGRAWSEPTLIRIAYAYEQSTKMRRRPSFTPTLRFA